MNFINYINLEFLNFFNMMIEVFFINIIIFGYFKMED